MNQNQALESLRCYREALAALRAEFGPVRYLPAVDFFLFGMGPRRKLIYRDGMLLDARSGEVLRRWDVDSAVIVPPAYSVFIRERDGKQVCITEDENAVWLEEEGERRALSEGGLHLPAFSGHKYAPILRVLHQEILINILDGLPVPNFLVYRKPWYRDGALMAMALAKTGNLGLIEDWILNLGEAYDTNNAGETEADNLGQALYLISLVADRDHPLVPQILAEFPKYEEDNHIRGRSDFAEHPVYQTKWAKFGLAALGLPDPYCIPAIPDSYSALFWWAYHDRHVEGSRFAELDYPYLGWAEAHFYAETTAPLGDRDYPLSWEANASQADYPALEILSPKYVEAKLSAPHTWHAVEMFLYLLERG